MTQEPTAQVIKGPFQKVKLFIDVLGKASSRKGIEKERKTAFVGTYDVKSTPKKATHFKEGKGRKKENICSEQNFL